MECAKSIAQVMEGTEDLEIDGATENLQNVCQKNLKLKLPALAASVGIMSFVAVVFALAMQRRG